MLQGTDIKPVDGHLMLVLNSCSMCHWKPRAHFTQMCQERTLMLAVTPIDKQPVSLFYIRSHCRMTQTLYLQQLEVAFHSGAMIR